MANAAASHGDIEFVRQQREQVHFIARLYCDDSHGNIAGRVTTHRGTADESEHVYRIFDHD